MKTKIIIAGVILALLITNLFLLKRTKNLKLAKAVQIENVKNLLYENVKKTNLTISLKQANAISSLKIDSLSKALKIKPKTIDKIVEIKQIIHDTIPKYIPVYLMAKNQWKISDKDKCWSWIGTATLQDSITLKVDRLSFDYFNKTTEIYYSLRPHKFLFFKWGKKKVFQKSSSECGDTVEREIIID